MPSQGVPHWTLVPFPALVVAIALLPAFAPRAWGRPSFQGLVVAICALPVLGHFVAASELGEVWGAGASYVTFVATLGALYVTSGGVHLYGEIRAKPSTNVGLIALGAALASVVGSTGASMLLIRPLLWTNRFREHRAHLVPFFIIAVANAGGLLTPLGDPPLLLGYIGGVPFFWTLRLLPAWVLYVGSAALALYFVDRRAYARESPAVRARCGDVPLAVGLRGKRNSVLLMAVGPAALLPVGLRELAMVAITTASAFLTPRSVRQTNGFSFAPIVEVAILFAGIFACLRPIELALAHGAPWLPLGRSWQLFWAAGLCSTVLDNAPTYTAFAALARGQGGHGADLVAGISAVKLAAVSIGCVVMGATTYIGNAPNLMIKALAERERFPVPTFLRHAVFAMAVMLPAHLLTTLALALLER